MDRRRDSFSAWTLCLLVVAFWTVDLAVMRCGTPDPLDDTWEYGVAARHLLAGDGFRTDVIHPPLWTLRDAGGSVPVLIHGPLMALLAVPLIAPDPAHGLDRFALLAALAAALAAWLLFRLGERMRGPAFGAAAALLFTISPLTLRAVHHDASLVFGALLLLAALERLLARDGSALAAGLAIGLASLARAEMAIAALVLMPLAGRRIPGYAAGVLCCLAPWWVHNLRACGLPLFNLSSYLTIGYWGARPELTVLRDFSLPPQKFGAALGAAWPTLPAKWADFAPHAIKRALLIPTGGTGWLASLGAIAVSWSAARARAGESGAESRARRVRFTVLIALAALPIAIMTVTLYDARYLTPFLPLWALAAVRGAELAAQVLPPWAHRPRAWIGAIALLVLPTLAPTWRDAATESHALVARLAAERAALAVRADRSRRTMFSDTPDFAAYVTSRPVVWITAAEYARLPAPDAPLDAMRPARSSRTDDTWFHAGSGRDSALTP